MEFLFQIGVIVGLMGVGLFFGRQREKKHFLDLQIREKQLLHLPLRAEASTATEYSEAMMVMGSVVIANDYFKSTVASLKNIFGGRLSSYESLMDRARREAQLRAKLKAAQWGAKEVLHFRFEMSSLDKLGIEIFAVGTAVK
jgi:uncharacterized protein YbjQ (UPF0145 family)